LSQGDRNTIYPLLFWILGKFPQLQKRAYLARFLANIECPPEFLQDEGLADLYEHYKALKEEFKTIHKQAEQMKKRGPQPQELKAQVTQLEEEKKQLINKINSTKKKVDGEPGFNELLEVTQKLRLEQEEEMKLMEREREQIAHLKMAERRYEETQRRLQEVQHSTQNDVSAEEMLQQLQREVKENQQKVDVELPYEIKTRMNRLNEARGKMSAVPRTEQECFDLKSMIHQIENEMESLNNEIQQAQKAGGDSKLAMFRQQAQLISKKLAKKEEALEEEMNIKSSMLREIDEKEALMAELQGPKFMKREEFKSFAAKLRNKTNLYKQMKAELGEIRSETVLLNRTEQLLKSRGTNLDEFLADLERKRGVSNYTSTEKRMQEVSEAQASVNEVKGKTLDEISKIVTDINQTLKERKNKLAPQIKELRAVRQRYQEVEQEHLEKKALFENTAAGLETERIKLEQESQAFQDDCLREESRYHYLQCMMQIAEAHHQRVEQEVEFERGHGRLLRDFQSYKELYQHKISQQEGLMKELRKRQKQLKESEGEHMGQRRMFADMRKLLAAKLKAKDNELRANSQAQQTQATDDALMMDIGGANVMTIE
jgi:intraflagellar transport protein 81